MSLAGRAPDAVGLFFSYPPPVAQVLVYPIAGVDTTIPEAAVNAARPSSHARNRRGREPR